MIKGASVSAMVDINQEKTAPNTVNNMSSKKELLSSALKRTSEWFASYSFVLSNCFLFYLFFYSLNVHEIMSVFFYVWPILLEKTLGERNIEDGVGVFNFFFAGFSPRRSQAMLLLTLEGLPFPCIRCYPISTLLNFSFKCQIIL